MPHTALWIFNITLIAGTDVNMDMENTLSCRLPDVNADVVTVGFKLFVQQLSLLVYQRHAGADLFGCQIKKGGNMATRDDHRMTRAHRVRIARAVRQFITQGNPFGVPAKQTWVVGVSL